MVDIAHRGASNARGRARMILVNLNGIIAEQALHFSFKSLNNKVKYETLLVGLKLVASLGYSTSNYSVTPN